MLTITPCVNPDLDGLACAIAYAEYYNKTGMPAQAIISGQPRFEADFLVKYFNYQVPPNIARPEDLKQVIFVDASRPDGLDKNIKLENVIEVVDHRLVGNPAAFPNAKIWIEMVGAAATLIAEKFQQNNIPISIESATLIYGAIIANTLNFQGSTMNNRDRVIADWLKSQINWPNDLSNKLFLGLNDLKGNQLLETIQSETFNFVFNGQNLAIGQLIMTGGKELVTSYHNNLVAATNRVKDNLNLERIVINIVDIGEKVNIFFSTDPGAQALLSQIFKIEFSNNYAVYPAQLLRKEIIPLIKKEIEKK